MVTSCTQYVVGYGLWGKTEIDTWVHKAGHGSFTDPPRMESKCPKKSQHPARCNPEATKVRSSYKHSETASTQAPLSLIWSNPTQSLQQCTNLASNLLTLSSSTSHKLSENFKRTGINSLISKKWSLIDKRGRRPRVDSKFHHLLARSISSGLTPRALPSEVAALRKERLNPYSSSTATVDGIIARYWSCTCWKCFKISHS